MNSDYITPSAATNITRNKRIVLIMDEDTVRFGGIEWDDHVMGGKAISYKSIAGREDVDTHAFKVAVLKLYASFPSKA